VNVGQRPNVTGSARFRKLITAGDYTARSRVARDQVQNGAQIIDVNMDEADRQREGDGRVPQPARREPDIARVPLMIDSSKIRGDRGWVEVASRASRWSTRSR